MPRVTIIDDTNETYEVSDPQIHLNTSGQFTHSVRFPNQGVFPDELVGKRQQQVRGWDIVVTDNETHSGTIRTAQALEITFRTHG